MGKSGLGTDVVDVEIATFKWVSRWNESRLHQSLGYRTPTEVKAEFWTGNANHERIEIKAKAQEQNLRHFNSYNCSQLIWAAYKHASGGGLDIGERYPYEPYQPAVYPLGILLSHNTTAFN